MEMRCLHLTAHEKARRNAPAICILMIALLSVRCGDYPTPTATSGSTPKTPFVGSPFVGGVAPDFSVKGVNGETVSLSQKRGKAVLLAFFGPGSG